MLYNIRYIFWILLLWAVVYPILIYAAVPSLKMESSVVTTIAGSGIKGAEDGLRHMAQFNWPTGGVLSEDENTYIADFGNNLIRRITPDGMVSTFAGTGIAGFKDGTGESAMFKGPDNIDIDMEGNIYVADSDNFRIRKISRDGIVTTIAGNGSPGFVDGKGDAAQFAYPTGVAVDGFGNIFVADRGSSSIRKIDRDGIVTTIAGNGIHAYADGLGGEAHFNHPIAIALDNEGNIFVSDSGNNMIRKINPVGRVTTIAGRTTPGYRDGNARENALFSWPTGIAIDGFGNLYVADSNNNRIRRISKDGVVSTTAGTAVAGYRDGDAAYSRFNFPTGLWVDRFGNIYVADSGNNRIRMVSQKGMIKAER